MRRSGFTAVFLHVIGNRTFRQAGFLGDCPGNATGSDRKAEGSDVVGLYVSFRQCCVNCFGNNLEIAFISYPSLFPSIIELFILAAEVIDKIDCFSMGGKKPGNNFAFTDEKRRSAVAGCHFQRAGCFGFALLRRSEQKGPAAALGYLQGHR